MKDTPTFNALTNNQTFHWSKSKALADDNFKFDENGGKLSKWVENTVVNGEIAITREIKCFQKNLYRKLVKTRACLGTG